MGKVLIANDHGAVDLKQRIVKHLNGRNIDVANLGVDTEDSVDYPDLAVKAVSEFRKGGYEFGILCCGTGIGISISANKMEGIRCALPQDSYAAEMTRKHNDSNFIAFGGRIDYKEPVEKILDAYMDATFEGGRHQNRVDKLNGLIGK